MTSFQVMQWLRQGIAAAKAGDAERARELLLQVVDADENNEQAWLWLSSVVDNDADREVCLENVLAINPDNNLAKAGLAHLRSRKAPPPAPPEPQPAPPPPVATTPTDEWRPSRAAPSAPAADDLLEARLATAAALTAEEAQAGIRPAKPARRRSARGLQLAAVLGFGLLAVAVGLLLIFQVGPFDPSRRDYAGAMRPVLADYDAWWGGAYGALLNELNGFCGPTADGWRNQDVLLNCSRYPAVDCALLAAHCGSDVDAMRVRVAGLSREAQKAGRTLLTAFEAVSVPADVAPAHARFLACLRARVADAVWAGELARGGPPGGPDHVPACQMFPDAEDVVRQYVGGW
jgi:hypothetical protein